jgi:hypothetical protein
MPDRKRPALRKFHRLRRQRQHADRPVLVGRELCQILDAERQFSRRRDAKKALAAAIEHDHRDARIGEQIADRVQPAVAGVVGQQQLAIRRHPQDARLPAARRNIHRALGIA